MRKIKVADLFCGAGGSSTGARQAIEAMGREMDLVCVNHWDRAIETHKRMHPEARHYCQDVASARPIECVPGGHLDLLMASVTCTYHGRARGGRPTSDQQRMDPWHVVTWLTELTVDRIIIENVPEFADWGPVDPKSGKPIKTKKGVYRAEWVATLDRLGFDYDWRFLNCADYGDATTRRRYFGMGRRRKTRKAVPARWPEPTHTKEPGHSLLAPLQKWRPARECIDWQLKGRSIFGRKHPLAPRTIQRIYAGAVRFSWPEPFLVVLRQHMDARSIDLPIPTIAARGTHIGIAQAVLIRSDSHGARKIKGRSPDEPLQTIVGSGGIAMAEPFLIGQHFERKERSIDEPVPAATTISRTGIAEPFVVSATHHGGFRGHDLETPMPTVTGAHRGERDGQLPRIHDLEMPMPTIPAQGSVRMAEAGLAPDVTTDGVAQYDILFRMLHWRELARAMSFSDADSDYEFSGTKTEITKQIGNAVPVRTARALVGAALWDMAA